MIIQLKIIFLCLSLSSNFLLCWIFVRYCFGYFHLFQISERTFDRLVRPKYLIFWITFIACWCLYVATFSWDWNTRRNVLMLLYIYLQLGLVISSKENKMLKNAKNNPSPCFFSSPGLKGHVSFSHHFASVSRLSVRPSSVHNYRKILSSETAQPILTKLW